MPGVGKEMYAKGSTCFCSKIIKKKAETFICMLFQAPRLTPKRACRSSKGYKSFLGLFLKKDSLVSVKNPPTSARR